MLVRFHASKSSAMQRMSKVINPFQSRRWRFTSFPLAMFASGILMMIIFLSSPRIHRHKIEGSSRFDTEIEDVTFKAGRITVHRESIDGMDVLWASPRDNDRGEVKGLLFLAHGCGHSHFDWFGSGAECRDCVGLPEETAIVDIALDMGLVAIATSSADRKSKCWNRFDVTPVALVLNELWHRFFQEHIFTIKPGSSLRRNGQLQKRNRLPLYAFGASSGGSFVSQLASPLLTRFGIKLDGFVSQIAAHLPTPEEEEKEPPNLCKVYVTMNKDTQTDMVAAARVRKCLEENNNGRCKQIRLPKIPIRPFYFMDRIEGVTGEESFAMVRLLAKNGFIHWDTGEILYDPRQKQPYWSKPLRRFANRPSSVLEFAKDDSMVADQSPIFEVLNVAWGYHETAREGVREALKFCMELP